MGESNSSQSKAVNDALRGQFYLALDGKPLFYRFDVKVIQLGFPDNLFFLNGAFQPAPQ